ncbi:MAG: zinc ribbon domain-containing protein [Verrucomicrobia bacterium]|nr:zinc ribbon domain-containing protein [Verrucomicrobiota bacterium]
MKAGHLLIAAVVIYFAARRLLTWIRQAPVKSDPWSPEIEEAVQQADATPLCHKCFTPQPPGSWFCEHCGSAVGPYNNWMPYVYVFSQGEVLRNGVTEKIRINVLTVAGYLLFSFSSYVVFAPADMHPQLEAIDG